MEILIPRNLIEFQEMYSTEEKCEEALIKMRWPEGFVCPKCSGTRGKWLPHHRRIQCNDCRRQTSPTSGTFFHGCKLPLRTLFNLIYLVVGEKDGMNNCALKRQLSINRKTAQLWSKKLRDTIGKRKMTPLSGVVEVDETMIGGPAEGCFGRALGENQSLVVILVEDDGGKCGRVRLETTPEASGKSLAKIVHKHVEKGSTVRTDGWKGYNEATSADYPHVVKIAETSKKASEELPLVHRVASLLKRYLLGTLHGSWSMAWLPWLLDEFSFRFNRRNAQCRPSLFNKIIQIGKNKRPPTRRQFQLLYSILEVA